MSTQADKVFGVIAIVAGMAIVVAAVTGFLVTPWVTAGASLVAIIWLAIVKRRPPEKKVYRTRL